MKMNPFKERAWRVRWMLVALLCCCFAGCSDDDDNQGLETPYDPNLPVTVTDFSPEEASYGEDIIIYGTNFGNDASKVKVTIGGKTAKVVGVKSTAIYCVVPQSAYGTEIQVEVTDGGENVLASAVCESKQFSYERQWLVSTEIGTHYETTQDEEEKDGPFNDCGIVSEVWWFSWDPLSNFDVLYATTDKGFYRKLDFAHENEDGTFGWVSTHQTRFDRVLAMTWTVDDACDMIYAYNHSNDNLPANYLYTRASEFTDERQLGGNARGVNTLVVHPLSEKHEMYFTRYRAGDVWRYDFETNEQEQIFVLPHAGLSAFMVIHPTGNYAYILMKEKHYIMRTDYDWENQTFTTPYAICGDPGGAVGFTESGVGTRVRLNQPIQGVFVKNPDYAGNSDEYDFYFCDKENHRICILTPTGRVTTFAGRGNNQSSGYNDGALRTQALFKGPACIAYDEKRNCFYVGDRSNKVIRTIRLEQAADVEGTETDEGGEETTETSDEGGTTEE